MTTSRLAGVCCIAALCISALTGCGQATTPGAAAPAVGESAPPAVVSEQPATATHTTSGLEGATLNAVVAGGDGMVAVGAHDGEAAAWTSSDGGTWQRADVADADAVEALHAVAVDGQAVAFGAAEGEASRAWSAPARARTWEPAASDGIDGMVNAVAVDGQRRVAVGDRVDAETATTTAGAVWTAAGDGTWRARQELPLNEGTVSDVALDGDTVVVVGFDIDGGKVWTATGDDELRTVGDAVFDAATVEAVARTAAGFLALGRAVGDLRPLAWTSDDGVSWTGRELPVDVFAPDMEINDLTTVDGTLIAAGTAPEGGVVWTSDDGASWALHAPAAGS